MATNLEDRLNEVASRLGRSYKKWKAGEKAKEKDRNEFFRLATEAQTELAQETIKLPGGFTYDEIKGWLAKHYPGWELIEVAEDPDDLCWRILIEEDPEFQPFVYEHDGWRYQRSVSQGSVWLDDEALRMEDPDLWLEVSELPYQKFLVNLAYECGVDGEDCEDRVATVAAGYPNLIERRLKDLDDLDSELLAKLQKYMYIGKPTVRLTAPTKVKDE